MSSSADSHHAYSESRQEAQLKRAGWMMPATAMALLSVVAIGLGIAFRWPLVHDATLIHYVVFLMAHGRAPYRDIIEMNLPGAYMSEWFAMHVFGGDAFGWWMWDTAAGILAVLSAVWIAGKGRRWAGIAGGCAGYLVHLRDGARNLGQRDWIVSVFLLIAVGFAVEGLRRARPVWMAGMMCFCGLAASIKPPALLLGVAVLFASCWFAWRDNTVTSGTASPHGADDASTPAARIMALLAWSLLGGLVPLAMSLLFLLHWGVTSEFLGILHGLVPWYASIWRVSLPDILKAGYLLIIFLGGSGVLFLLGKSWKDRTFVLVAIAAFMGSSIFFIQDKGWQYHLYPGMVFGTLWAMLELDQALQTRTLRRTFAFLALPVTVVVLLVMLLHATQKNNRKYYSMDTVDHLQADLTELGGQQLSGSVQCLDTTKAGCINVLYRMKLMQSTGFIYNFYLFPIHNNAVTDPLRRRFLSEIEAHWPKVIVISNDTPPNEPQGYVQLAYFPDFVKQLQLHYHLDREYLSPVTAIGYRIYVLNPESSSTIAQR